LKTFITTILLSVILLYAAGYEIVFACLLINCGEEASQKELKSYKETTLVINSSNSDHLTRKNKKEIIFEGVLYDIKSEETAGKDLIIHCVTDKDEQELLNNFATFHNESGKKNGNKPIEGFIYKNQLTLFFANNILTIEPLLNSEQTCSYGQFFYLQPEIELFTPPPQTFLV
jgi:hypothetical protein